MTMVTNIFSKTTLILIFWLSLLAGGPARDQACFAEQPPGKSIPVVTVASSINPGVAEFVLRQIAKAEKENAPALVIQLDTPGGLDTSMRTIVQGLLNAQIPVVVFVSPSGARAASAGVMIVLAADVAAMAPGTNIGAASPVNIGGKDIEKTMARKVENDMVAYARSIAAQRQRNADWAARAVSKSESLPAEKALELKVIDLMAKDLPDLLQKIDGLQVSTGKQPKVLRTKGTPTIYVQEGFRDRVLRTISDPNIAYLLMMLGTMGIFFELMNPGNIFPGVIGGISLILAFFALQTLPVNYAGLLLILLAIVFFIAEIKVISHGVLSIGGVVSLTLGSLLLFRTADSHLRVALGVLVPVVIVVSGFFLAVVSLAIRAHQRKPQTGAQGILGEVGRVRQPIRRETPGKVFVHGEIWNARSEESLEPGEVVEVVGIDHLLLTVRKKAL
jgi:membrane-bound serine protease (ClpP class)